MNNRDAHLQQFFGGYFNQDWDIGGATSWSEVVDGYLRENSASHAAITRDSLRAWLTDGDGCLPASFGCDYDPRPDGMDERTWVRAIADYIEMKLVS